MFAPRSVVHADNGTAICTYQADASKNIGTCINRIYIISLAVGGVLAVLFFVVAGYLYMSGGDGVGQAKKIIISTVTGLIILFSAFLFLNTINPDLTSFTGLTLDNMVCGSQNVVCTAPTSNFVNGAASTTGGITSTGGSGIAACSVAVSSTASPAALQQIFGNNAIAASKIAQAESSGNPGAGGDTCEIDGNNASIGLFQINISANSLPASVTGGTALNCPSAFNGSASAATLDPATKDYKCSVSNQALYDQCTNAMEDPNQNALEAFQLSKGGTNWSPWSTHTACGL